MAKPTVAQLHKRLQPVFNHYIRLRDTQIVLGHRIGDCISCNLRFLYSQLQAGHFLPVNNYATRYSESNVNIQCQQCNGFRKSNWPGYTEGMIRKYGIEQFLLILSQWGKKRVYSVDELLGMIDYYKAKVKEMEA